MEGSTTKESKTKLVTYNNINFDTVCEWLETGKAHDLKISNKDGERFVKYLKNARRYTNSL